MKKLKALVFFLALSLLVGCTTEDISAGYVGVLVHKYGSEKGVSTEILGPGRHTVGMNDEVFKFPTFTQNYTYSKSANEGKAEDESLNFSVNGGVVGNVDIGISFQFEREHIPKLFQTYQKPVEELLEVVIRNEIRNALNVVGSHYTVDQLLDTSKAEFIQKVKRAVSDTLSRDGITIKEITFASDIRWPQDIATSINQKNQAIIRAKQAEYSEREAAAMAAKDSIKASGQAKASAILAQGMSDRYIEARKLDIMEKEVEAYAEGVRNWDHHAPTTYVAGGNGNPFGVPNPPIPFNR